MSKTAAIKFLWADLKEKFKVYYETKSVLGGIIKKNIVVRRDRLTVDLEIVTSEEPYNVFVNGVLYVPADEEGETKS